jgi:hypothetical protein
MDEKRQMESGQTTWTHRQFGRVKPLPGGVAKSRQLFLMRLRDGWLGAIAYVWRDEVRGFLTGVRSGTATRKATLAADVVQDPTIDHDL